jgi:hypothetical protein
MKARIVYFWSLRFLSGVGACFNLMWTEHGMHVACWSAFALQGLHRFEVPRLSDMSNRLFVAVST